MRAKTFYFLCSVWVCLFSLDSFSQVRFPRDFKRSAFDEIYGHWGGFSDDPKYLNLRITDWSRFYEETIDPADPVLEGAIVNHLEKLNSEQHPEFRRASLALATRFVPHSPKVLEALVQRLRRILDATRDEGGLLDQLESVISLRIEVDETAEANGQTKYKYIYAGEYYDAKEVFENQSWVLSLEALRICRAFYGTEQSDEAFEALFEVVSSEAFHDVARLEALRAIGSQLNPERAAILVERLSRLFQDHAFSLSPYVLVPLSSIALDYPKLKESVQETLREALQDRRDDTKIFRGYEGLEYEEVFVLSSRVMIPSFAAYGLVQLGDDEKAYERLEASLQLDPSLQFDPLFRSNLPDFPEDSEVDYESISEAYFAHLAVLELCRKFDESTRPKLAETCKIGESDGLAQRAHDANNLVSQEIYKGVGWIHDKLRSLAIALSEYKWKDAFQWEDHGYGEGINPSHSHREAWVDAFEAYVSELRVLDKEDAVQELQASVLELAPVPEVDLSEDGDYQYRTSFFEGSDEYDELKATQAAVRALRAFPSPEVQAFVRSEIDRVLESPGHDTDIYRWYQDQVLVPHLLTLSRFSNEETVETLVRVTNEWKERRGIITAIYAASKLESEWTYSAEMVTPMISAMLDEDVLHQESSASYYIPLALVEMAKRYPDRKAEIVEALNEAALSVAGVPGRGHCVSGEMTLRFRGYAIVALARLEGELVLRDEIIEHFRDYLSLPNKSDGWPAPSTGVVLGEAIPVCGHEYHQWGFHHTAKYILKVVREVATPEFGLWELAHEVGRK